MVIRSLMFGTVALLATEAAETSTQSKITLEDLLGTKVKVHSADESEPLTVSIEDLYVTMRTGRVQYAVLSGDDLETGDAAIPFARLQWDAAADCFNASVDKEHLNQHPPFDAEAARRDGLDSAVGEITVFWQSRSLLPDKAAGEDSNGSKQESEDHRVKFAEVGFIASPAVYTSAEEWADCPIYAYDQEFGSVETTIIDLEKKALEFAVVSHGGLAGVGDERYLVPVNAMMACHKDGEPALVIARKLEALTSMPQYEEPNEGLVTEEMATRARQAFRDADASVRSE